MKQQKGSNYCCPIFLDFYMLSGLTIILNIKHMLKLYQYISFSLLCFVCLFVAPTFALIFCNFVTSILDAFLICINFLSHLLQLLVTFVTSIIIIFTICYILYNNIYIIYYYYDTHFLFLFLPARLIFYSIITIIYYYCISYTIFILFAPSQKFYAKKQPSIQPGYIYI